MMSSILTNEGAMIALHTLRSINEELSITRNEISTGKKVSTSSEGSAIWAISKTMSADVEGFKNVSDNLALGDSTVAVARQGAETITNLLTDIKGLVIAGQGENVDRSKIQNNIEQLREQIDGIVGMANFNGENLLQNTDDTAGSGSIAVLASVDRSGSTVSSTDITIRRRDLGTGAAAIAATGGTYSAADVTATLNATRSVELDTGAVAVEAGAAFSLSIFGTDADGSNFATGDLNSSALAAQTQAEMSATEISYVAQDGDTMGDVSKALVRAFEGYAARNDIGSDTLQLTAAGSTITATSQSTDGTDTIAVSLNTLGADADNTIGGGLATLGALDINSDAGAAAAMGQIEALLGRSIDSAAAFGSDQSRIETQSEFVSKISDALKAGIGQLVDADMEESSARLQALQVQQQLAVQALSIANSAPQQLLGLFR